MKTKVTIIKGCIFIVIILNAIGMCAQKVPDYTYIKATLDPNNLFGIIDNPRTKVESYGLDYDIEIGARHKWGGVYAFYGAFPKINYQNFGAGFDVYINLFGEKVDTSLGVYNGMILRKYYGYNNEVKWGAYIAPAVRGVTTLWFFDNAGLTGTALLSHRPDIGFLAIFEGHIGIVYRRHNSNRRFNKR